MDQPAPNITAADVERLVKRDFDATEVPAVLAALEAYGTKAWHREPLRVRAAMLKIARGDFAELQRALGIADTDFRDVLVAAEYPRYIQEINPSETDATKRQAVVAADWKQYSDWLKKSRSPTP